MMHGLFRRFLNFLSTTGFSWIRATNFSSTDWEFTSRYIRLIYNYREKFTDS